MMKFYTFFRFLPAVLMLFANIAISSYVSFCADSRISVLIKERRRMTFSAIPVSLNSFKTTLHL